MYVMYYLCRINHEPWQAQRLLHLAISPVCVGGEKPLSVCIYILTMGSILIFYYIYIYEATRTILDPE